jgi:mono/diheme cytochrome c family protein
MRVQRAAGAVLACSLALAAAAADLNGPMSSTPRAAASTTSQAEAQVQPQGGQPVVAPEAFDVRRLFATTCGWCHSSGGRVAGRGPKLMETTLTDAEIVARIRNGKTGAMPAFGTAFNEDQLQAILHYIRGLKPEGATP